MRSFQIWMLAGILCTLGLGLFLFKSLVLGYPTQPDSKYQSWYIESTFSLLPSRTYSKERPVVFKLRLPPQSAGELAIADESYVAPGFGTQFIPKEENTTSKTNKRWVEFSKRNIKQNERLLYRAMVYKLDSPEDNTADAPATYTSEYLPANRTLEEDAPVYLAIDTVLSEAREKSGDINTLARELYRISQQTGDGRIKVITAQAELEQRPTVIAHFLMAAAGIPVRLVNGIQLIDEAKESRVIQWIEFRNEDKEWQPIDPSNGQIGMPGLYMPWWYGTDTVYKGSKGVKQANRSISIRKNTDNSLTRAIWKSSEEAPFLSKFSLFNLELKQQLMLKVLLLIPLGGLIIAFLRQVIGFTTFGTFMPVLIALSFLSIGWAIGFLLYGSVIALGLVLRTYFHKLHLLMVPRLTAVMTIVVLIIVVMQMLGQSLKVESVFAFSLFPIVVLTMMIERMSLMVEEMGAGETMRILFYTAVAVLICYAIISSSLVAHLLFTFPELLLVILAASILLGRYNGYKLLEYFRFKALQRHVST